MYSIMFLIHLQKPNHVFKIRNVSESVRGKTILLPHLRQGIKYYSSFFNTYVNKCLYIQMFGYIERIFI